MLQSIEHVEAVTAVRTDSDEWEISFMYEGHAMVASQVWSDALITYPAGFPEEARKAFEASFSKAVGGIYIQSTSSG